MMSNIFQKEDEKKKLLNTSINVKLFVYRINIRLQNRHSIFLRIKYDNDNY
jgi:hypothetical protein